VKTIQKFLAGIRQCIACDDLDITLQQLRSLLEHSPRLDEILLQSACWHDIRQQIRLGLVSYENATLTKNQIRAGLLDLLREIEVQSEQPGIGEEVERAVSVG
jgi:effector-associated domain 11 (EAD11)-containing protein